MAGFWCISCLISLLWLTQCSSGDPSTGEYVSVHTLQETSNPCSLPKSLDAVIERHQKDTITFKLIKNEFIKVPSSVMIMTSDSITGETIFEPVEIPKENEAYHNNENEACIAVHCSKNTESNDAHFILEGTFFHDGMKYMLSPPQDNTADAYVLEEVVEFDKPTDHGYIRDPKSVTPAMISERRKRRNGTERKRRKRSVTNYYLDILPVIDYALFSRWYAFHGNDTFAALNGMNTYFTNVFTGISLRYETLNLHDNIVLNIRTTVPFFSLDESTSPFTENNKVLLDDGRTYVNIETQLEQFREWLHNNTGNLAYHDHAMLFSGYDWYGNDITATNVVIKGLAYVATFCTREGLSASVNQDRMRYQSDFVAAHELGHSLGAPHDGNENDCDSSDLYVMAAFVNEPSRENMFNNFIFSSCSSNHISDFIEYLEETEHLETCLIAEVGNPIPSYPVVRMEDMCPKMFGAGSTFCTDRNPLAPPFICASLYCNDGTGDCGHFVPATGTCCGNGKQCVDGLCTETSTNACVYDEDCPFGDHVECATSIVAGDYQNCWDEVVYSYCCRYCVDRLDYAVAPTSPPELIVDSILVKNNDEKIALDLDKFILVFCSVLGGAPLASSVTIVCDGFESDTSAGNSNFFNFTSSAEVHEIQCVCSATHITGLYDLTTAFRVDIKVTPPSGAPVLTVNEKEIPNGGNVEIQLDRLINTHCSVDGGFPDVSNMTIACTGMEEATEEGASVRKRIFSNQDVDQAECVCSAQHTSGQYAETTSFVIHVLDPPQIKTYSIDSNTDTSQDIHVTAGSPVDFVCQAKGIPAPSVSIKRVSSGLDVDGTTTTSPSDAYTKIFSETKKVVCADTGNYRCTASNGVGDNDVKDLSVFVDCPPTLEDNSIPVPPATIDSMGRFQTSFQVVSNPLVQRFKLVKYERKRYTGRVIQMKEYKPDDYLVTVTYDNLINSVTLEMVDSLPGEYYFFTLQLINGVEPALSVSFNSTIASPDGSSTHVEGIGQVGNIINLYVVAAALGIFVCALFLGTIVYVSLYQKGTRLHKKAKKLSQKKKSLNKHQMDPRVWMSNPGISYY